ncbi:MAG: LysM peptidoglycan-binding domain-containing protein [Candidatus Omnitrophica bacterium]|nr:LysM peptidoglycan-binding domain-containing protein [Candidatus Omnitrophota bacterium]
MKKYFIILGIVFLSGCLVRTYTTEKPRVDLEIEGNRGYLMGNAPTEQKELDSKLGGTRKVSVMEVELGPHHYLREPAKQPATGAKEPAQEIENTQPQPEPSAMAASAVKEDYQEYTVAKEDTLQKISQKFYGTTKKWQMLYEANKDVLSGPDKLFPGAKIKIPSQ